LYLKFHYTIMNAELHVIGQQSPDDLDGVRALVASGNLDPAQIVAFLNKTEGNGCVNDFARGYCSHVIHQYLDEVIGAEASSDVLSIMSGGCEGVISPHMNVFSSYPDEGAKKTGGLILGTGRTRDFTPAEIGRLPMVEETAKVVRELMRELELPKEEVHFVQIKCPLISSADVIAARASGEKLVTEDTLKSMGWSRGASSLGVALALGEANPSTVEAAILSDLEVFSSVASSSSGIELKGCEVLVMGNSPKSSSSLRIGHAVMKDAIDREAVLRACAESQGRTEGFEVDRVVNVFAKSEVNPSGLVRGARHTMLQDSDINGTRMSRAVVGAIVSSVLGRTQVYVSGGAEHQGPPGGGPVCAISRID
jgi:cyanuric acid amidohydrolase